MGENVDGRPVEFGVYLNHHGGDYPAIRSSWLAAERLGFDAIWTMDNIVGPVPYQPEHPVLDAWTLLPVMAEITERVKIGPLVTPFARRHPAVMAKSSTVVDLISNGRLQLAMGPGDEPQQHLPWGQAYPKASERIAILCEELEIIKRMWTEEKATFKGEHYAIDQAINSPKPIQQPHPPIWIGLVFGKKLMPVVAAKYADGINFYNGVDSEVEDMLRIVGARCEEQGRDVSKIKRSRCLGVSLMDRPFDLDETLVLEAEASGMPLEEMKKYYTLYERHIGGPPEEVAQGIFDATIALGIEQPIVNLRGWGKRGGPGLEEDMERFMTEVVPIVRELARDRSGSA